MSHLNMSFGEVMEMSMLHVSMLVSESTPRFDKKEDDEVEMDTYYGKVKAKKQFII